MTRITSTLDSSQWTIIVNGGLWSISKLIDIILRDKNDDDGIKTSRFIHMGKPIFECEIIDKKDKYERNIDSVFFRAKYKGKIEYGYFAAKIIPPVRFPSDTFHLDESGNATSFCEKTINGNIENDWNIDNIPTNLGKLRSRNIKTKWFEWTWKIPQYASKGDYRIIIGLWSDSNEDDDKIIPIEFYEGSFYVTDSYNSHYPTSVAN